MLDYGTLKKGFNSKILYFPNGKASTTKKDKYKN